MLAEFPGRRIDRFQQALVVFLLFWLVEQVCLCWMVFLPAADADADETQRFIRQLAFGSHGVRAYFLFILGIDVL